MLDQEKNNGVLQVWGDLYRNPFTAGFIIVPKQLAWESTKNLEETHQWVDREIVSFLTRNKATDLWETLRLLNWVGVPPTQHSAARTQYGVQWAHVLGYADLEDKVSSFILRSQLGMRDSYKADYLELCLAVPEGAQLDSGVANLSEKLNEVFNPTVPPTVVRTQGKAKASVQFVLPKATKMDLVAFHNARNSYDQLSWTDIT